MPKSKLRLLFFGFILFILIFLFLFTGCASIDFKNKHDLAAYNLAKQISNLNKDIETAKGLGWLKVKKVRNETSTETVYKIAWISEPPKKIRITLLSGGFPVETIVSNGESITLFSHTGEHSLKTYNIDNPSLEDIISIPVKLEDIILLLSGHVPIKDFKYAFFDNNEVDLKTIVLKNISDKGIQKISINHKNQIKKYLVTNWRIEPLYNVTFFNYKTIDSVTMPLKLTIQDNLNREVSIEISKFYKNLPVKKSTFSLTEKR